MKKIIFLIGLYMLSNMLVYGRDTPSLYDRIRDRSENRYVYDNSAEGYYDGSNRQYDMTLPSNDWSDYRTYDWQPGMYDYDR